MDRMEEKVVVHSNSYNKIIINEDTELPQNARVGKINASKRAKQIRVKSLVSKNKNICRKLKVVGLASASRSSRRPSGT